MKDFSAKQVFAVEQKIPGEIPSIPQAFLRKFPELQAYDEEMNRFWRKLRASLAYSTEQVEEQTQTTQSATEKATETIQEDYPTTAEVDAAIAAAIAGYSPPTFESYPAWGTNASAQSIIADEIAVKILIGVVPQNTAGAMDTVNSRYTAPVTGTYLVNFTSQFDNNGGDASDMQVCVDIRRNGVGLGLGTCSSTPSPVGSRWFPAFGTLVSMTAGEYIELWVTAVDGVGAAGVNLTTFDFFVHRIK